MLRAILAERHSEMTEENEQRSLSRAEIAASVVVLVGTIVALAIVLPRILLLVGAVIVGATILVFGAGYAIYRYRLEVPRRLSAIPIWILLLFPLLVAAASVWYFEIVFSLSAGLIFLSLMLFVTIYWTSIPLALFQHYGEQFRTVEIEEWPSVTAMIPAYNEEGYVGRCIDSVLENDYPGSLEVVVVDDGSTDRTLAEAQARASDRLRVIHKENGGKHAALNDALTEVDSDLIVSVDADSLVDSAAIQHLVETYKWHNEPCAVAGNIKIMHRESALERIQALEYIVSINMFRRALDHLGLVNVVPGCLGLFERNAVEEVGGFSADTVTEDFDFTLSLLKQGKKVHYSAQAISRTEAPRTLRQMYNQRLRWYRGTIQTLRKHKDIVSNTSYGLLHVVLMPYMWMSVGLAPILGFIVLAAIVWTSLFGSFVEVLGLIVIFVILEALFGATALLIENDIEKEDYWLLRYTPLMVIGYKQLQDYIMLRSLFDVTIGRRVGWTSAGRNRRERDAGSSEQSQPLPDGSKATVDVYRDKADMWRWRLVHDNGNIIARSTGSYPKRTDAESDIERARQTITDAVIATLDEGLAGSDSTDEATQPRFELYRDKAGEWRWRFIHDDSEIMADSGEGYTRKAGAQNGLDSVRRNLPSALISTPIQQSD